LNKIVLTKKTSAIFLATVLVLGTITLFLPSFMTGAQAQEYYDGIENNYENDYGKDDRDKSKDNKIVKKVNCNNINANVNGLEIDGLPPALSGLAASEADEGERDVNSYGSYDSSGQQSGYDNNNNNNNFKFVCINNNNNTVIGGEGEEEEPIPEPDLACEECFAANITLQRAIVDFLVDFDGVLVNAGPFGIIVLGPGTDTIEQLCDMIESSASLYGVPMSDVVLKFFFSDILGVDPETPNSGIDALIECLLEAGIIVHREIPPPPTDSISANGIAGANSQCIGDPLCESLLQAQMTNSNSLGSSTNINTDTSEFQGTTNSPIIAQGTGDSTALEKITKLKQQWLGLLP
jgi:hypothetical protein